MKETKERFPSGLTLKQRGALFSSRLFHGMTEEEARFAFLAMDGILRRFRRGEYILHQGEALSRFGLVLSGAVEVYSDDIEGNRMMMASVLAGETFGESLSYLAIPAPQVQILAAEDSLVLLLSAEALVGLSPVSDPKLFSLAERFSRMLAERALAMNDRIQILSKKTIRLRLLAYFTVCRRRFGNATFAIPMSRERLAVYLGVNRSALSRELSQMQKEGLISYYRETVRLHYEKEIENNS